MFARGGVRCFCEVEAPVSRAGWGGVEVAAGAWCGAVIRERVAEDVFCDLALAVGGEHGGAVVVVRWVMRRA